jgi:AcrR family transcriptional regulator
MMAAAKKAREQLRRARREVDRQHLLDTAERVFAERGFVGTRMIDIAREVGLALATVYNLADSKEALYAEIHRERGGEMLRAAMAATLNAGSAWQALQKGVEAYVRFLVEHKNYLVLHLHESQPWALTPRFITDEQTRLWEEGLDLSVRVFESAISEGAVVDEDPRTLARLMIAAHQVFLGEWVASGMAEETKDLIARMQAHVERAFHKRRK